MFFILKSIQSGIVCGWRSHRTSDFLPRLTICSALPSQKCFQELTVMFLLLLSQCPWLYLYLSLLRCLMLSTGNICYNPPIPWLDRISLGYSVRPSSVIYVCFVSLNILDGMLHSFTGSYMILVFLLQMSSGVPTHLPLLTVMTCPN